MGFSNLQIRNRIMSLAIAATAVITLLPSNVFAQEKLQQIGGSAAPLSADNEPVVVVTFASLSKLMKDVSYITSVAGQPQAGGMFQMIAGTATQGLDTTKPLGIMVPMVNGMPEPIIALPTSDVKTVLKRLEPQTGPVDELDDGTLVIAVGANTVFIRQSGEWAIAARNRDVLELAPADPTVLFEGMGNDYDIAFRVKVQQIPEDVRGMLTDQMRQGFEQAMAQQADAEGTREMAQNSIEQIETLLNEADEINFGMNISEANQYVSFDFDFTAMPGTELASIYAGQKAIPSQFTTVIRDDAAAYLHGASSINPDAVEMNRKGLESSLGTVRGALANADGMTPEQSAKLTELIDRLGDLYIESISEGKMDMGGLLLSGPSQMQFVFGAFVSDGSEAAAIVKDFAEEVKNEKDAPRFKFDIGVHNGVTMHVVEADVPANADEVRQAFGDTIQVHIGTGDKSLYLATGRDSEALLKQFIDNGSTADAGSAGRPISQMKLRLRPILEFAKSMDDNEAVAAMISALDGSDTGEISVVGDAIPNGAKSQFLIGEGLIRAIGAAALQAQNAKAQF